MVVQTIKLKHRQLSDQIKINVGDLVKVNHPKLQGCKLIVKKVNRVTASLQIEGQFALYDVPLSFIEVQK